MNSSSSDCLEVKVVIKCQWENSEKPFRRKNVQLAGNLLHGVKNGLRIGPTLNIVAKDAEEAVKEKITIRGNTSLLWYNPCLAIDQVKVLRNPFGASVFDLKFISHKSERFLKPVL